MWKFASVDLLKDFRSTHHLGNTAPTDYADNGHQTWEKCDRDDESVNRRK